jgi:hypothetical protein
MTFKGVSFKSFVLICSLAQRIAEGDDSIKRFIQGIDINNLGQKLKTMKGLFYFHTSESRSETVCHLGSLSGDTDGMQISLETLSLDLKSAGNFTVEMEVLLVTEQDNISDCAQTSIISTLKRNGIEELNFFDFLVSPTPNQPGVHLRAGLHSAVPWSARKHRLESISNAAKGQLIASRSHGILRVLRIRALVAIHRVHHHRTPHVINSHFSFYFSRHLANGGCPLPQTTDFAFTEIDWFVSISRLTS